MEIQYPLEKEAGFLFSFYKQYMDKSFMPFTMDYPLHKYYQPELVASLTRYKSFLETRLLLSDKKPDSIARFCFAKELKVLIRKQREAMRPYLIKDQSELDALIGLETKTEVNELYGSITELERWVLSCQDWAMQDVLRILDTLPDFDRDVFDLEE